MLTEDLLDELEGHWRRQRAPLVEGLQPGLTDQDIDELTAPLEIRLPREARMWWQWHDGAGSTGERAVCREFGPGLAFYSLREAVDMCRQIRNMFRDIWAADGPEVVAYWWRPSWFPITESRGAIAVTARWPTTNPPQSIGRTHMTTTPRVSRSPGWTRSQRW
jgi:cell wall assembly regulator SMI1